MLKLRSLDPDNVRGMKGIVVYLETKGVSEYTTFFFSWPL